MFAIEGNIEQFYELYGNYFLHKHQVLTCKVASLKYTILRERICRKSSMYNLIDIGKKKNRNSIYAPFTISVYQFGTNYGTP